jgi:predicted MFS family arabinose efflux permease
MIEIQQEEGVRLIDEPEDSEKAYHRSGVVFIFLYGILTIYAIFCFYTRLHLFGTQQVDIHKKVIHVCIVVQGICETLYGVSFIVHRQ